MFSSRGANTTTFQERLNDAPELEENMPNFVMNQVQKRQVFSHSGERSARKPALVLNTESVIKKE